MNLNYSDEQNMLRDQVLKFCETNYDFIDREKILVSETGYSEENWKQFADLGWLAVPFKEDNGGFNFGPIELTVLFEEFGKALVVEPYLSSVVMSGTVLEGSNHAEKSSIIEKIIAGECQVSVAYAEPNIGYNFLECLTTVSNGDNGMKLNGSKSLVLNAGNADQFIILAKKDGSPCMVLIDSQSDGLSVQSFKTLDGQTCGELTFENVQVDDQSVLAEGDDAEKLFNKMVDISILCISAEAVGAMTASYTKTVQYTKEREQFAQPISNFQVLQHRMVDMFIETELTKSLLIKATLQLDSDDPDAVNTISALKVQVGKAGRLIGQHAVQLHGGMGVSNEMSIGHYLKRFTAIDSMFGNTQYHINKYQSK